METNTLLLNTLVSKGLLTAERLEELQKRGDANKPNLAAIIVSLGYVEEEKLTQVKAELAGLPYHNIADEVIPKEVLNFLSEDIARGYKIVCFSREGQTVNIGLLDPDLKAMEAVNFLASDDHLHPVFYIISESSFQRAIKQYQKIEEEISSALEVRAKEEGEELVQVQSDQEGQGVDDEDINSAPVSKIVSVIIRHAVEARASDIHIEPFENESRIRYRIDGILHTSLTLPKSIHPAIIARIKVLAKLKLDETRVPQDGRIRLLINGREVDFRISTLPLAGGEKVVMRILDTNRATPTLESLGFNINTTECITRGMKKTSGIMLVTGPTGSGKTTTLYAILSVLNQEGVNISTLEDPVEYEIKGINQAQIRPKVGFTFASGLRSLLRQDPNIIMVGEIRDDETADLAINAALTGHLVLSTLHTNDAISTVFRLLDMKVEAFLLSSTLKTIVAQRLARKLCDKCRQAVQLPPEELQAITDELKNIPVAIMKEEIPGFTTLEEFWPRMTFYKAVGCPHCENTGYVGRTSISEAIEINDELKQIINENSVDLTLAAVKKSQNFVSIKQDGLLKAVKGVTTVEEVLRVIEN